MNESKLWPLVREATDWARRLEDRVSAGVPDVLAVVKRRMITIELKAGKLEDGVGLNPEQTILAADLALQNAPHVILALRYPPMVKPSTPPIDIVGLLPAAWGLSFEQTRRTLLDLKMIEVPEVPHRLGTHELGGKVICVWRAGHDERMWRLDEFLRSAALW